MFYKRIQIQLKITGRQLSFIVHQNKNCQSHYEEIRKMGYSQARLRKDSQQINQNQLSHVN